MYNQKPNTKEEKQRGELTIFLGAASGVGKTYAMLEAALARQEEGADVAAAWIDTHGRKETEAMLEKLPRISPAETRYSNRICYELDLDAIIERHPQIVLIDDLNHSNVPGSRHPRRYMDVEDILAAGIDVYTTVNIEHIESLNDAVTQITGIQVKETIPDLFIRQADQVQLVDITPEILLKRLKEGKVYIPPGSENAISQYFRPGNFSALRELSLRHTAQWVDQNVIEYRQQQGIEEPWPTTERVLACISSNPFSVHVLRRAHQLATNLKAEFIVLYVETPRLTRNTHAMRESLTQNLLMAEDMGAELVHVMGKNIAEEILEVARNRNATQIVIGKPLRNPLRSWLTISLVDRIIQNSAGISVHVIPARVEPDTEAEGNQGLYRAEALVPFIGTLLQILVLTAVLKTIPWHIDPVNIVMIYLIPVLYAARYGMGPALFAAFISLLVVNFIFMPPYFEITFDNIRYLVTDIIYLGIAVLTSTLGSQLKLQMEETKNRENRTRALYELSRQIAAVTNMDELVYRITEQVGNTVNGKTVIYLPDTTSELQLEASSDEQSALTTDHFEHSAALLAFEQNKMVGHGCSTLPSARGIYLPLQAEDEVLGVLGVELSTDGARLSPEQRNLLEALAGLSAIAIGRARLAHKAQEIITLQESERLHTALFNSISHDLRTPLASITGAASSLIEEGEVYSPQERKALLETIYTGANRMNRLVGNLLDMARLQSGLMKINTDWCEVEDLIGIVLGGNRNGQPRTFRTDVPADLPLLHVDLPLMEHVLSNLIDNAIKYSPPEEDIDIWARHLGDEIWIAVADRGPGIPPEDQEKVFDKFYRLHSPRHVSGTGLGLSIVKAIVEAHGGRVWCEGREGGGSVFILALPAQDFLSTMKTLEKETKIK